MSVLITRCVEVRDAAGKWHLVDSYTKYGLNEHEKEQYDIVAPSGQPYQYSCGWADLVDFSNELLAYIVLEESPLYNREFPDDISVEADQFFKGVPNNPYGFTYCTLKEWQEILSKIMNEYTNGVYNLYDTHIDRSKDALNVKLDGLIDYLMRKKELLATTCAMDKKLKNVSPEKQREDFIQAFSTTLNGFLKQYLVIKEECDIAAKLATDARPSANYNDIRILYCLY